MSTQNSKTNECNKFIYQFTGILNLNLNAEFSFIEIWLTDEDNKSPEIGKLGKSKNKEKDEISEIEEIHVPPEKRQQIIDELRLY